MNFYDKKIRRIISIIIIGIVAAMIIPMVVPYIVYSAQENDIFYTGTQGADRESGRVQESETGRS